jgi:hypothetical protein
MSLRDAKAHSLLSIALREGEGKWRAGLQWTRSAD